jgi:hypothetical protein
MPPSIVGRGEELACLLLLLLLLLLPLVSCLFVVLVANTQEGADGESSIGIDLPRR